MVDQLRVDGLHLLGNDTNLALLGLVLVNPMVIDTTNVVNLVEGAIQVNDLVLETSI